MQRHFTVTGFVSQRGRTALHWHRLEAWLPPGGHIEPNEDPLQAVLREVREETGGVLPTSAGYGYARPPQLPVPAAMAVYDLEDGDGQLRDRHQHIDLIYFTRPLVADGPAAARDGEEAWVWVDEPALRAGAVVTDAASGRSGRVADDVRELALAAIAAERAAPARAGR